MEPLFEIQLEPAPAGSRDAARNVQRQLEAAILDGRLQPGTRLPPTRQAKRLLGVSRNTAAEIYERLLNAGLVEIRRGSGAYVCATAPKKTELPAPDPRDATRGLNPFWLRPDITEAMAFWRETTDAVETGGAGQAIDFRPALVDPRLFPFEVYRRISAKQLRRLERKPAGYRSPQGNQGNHHLRQAICAHIAQTRAVVCEPGDVLVTSGAQQAFDLLARVLVTPGETVVAIEDPGYPPLRVAFAAAGARLTPVPVDEEGLVVDRIPREARVVCVTPSHQFPLGVSLSPRRRAALLQFAHERGAVVVEDDYDGEFRLDGGSFEALRTSQAADLVFYVGTFSKCMLPALRLGFVVAPRWVMHSLAAAKNALDWHCSIPVQLEVAGFIAEGHLSRHVRRLRRLYGQRRKTVLGALRHDLADWLEPLASGYGMHVTALSRSAVDVDAVAQDLLGQGVKLHALSRYYLDAPARAGLVFGYGGTDEPAIVEGLSRLRRALETRS